MQGKATIAGHPIHPMLVPFPIAFFVGALVSDIISHWGDSVFWPRMSVVLIGLGIIGALLSALFGFIDYATAPLSDGAKKTATTHMALNLTVVVIFAIAFYLRLGNATSGVGYVLTVLGVLILGVSGYLGGQLVYEGGVGVKDSVGS
ncbi:MAG: hypothetical protein DLM50_06795 [Candidatus Meridianibacter frigidus]|nr:MAG: hypothetical protein DLM50_06795 [Candidatus Eremiobacteraeota bacterium]